MYRTASRPLREEGLGMRIAALVIGIIAGLTGLTTATYGHAIFGLFSESARLLYFLPIATFIGAGLALNKPVASAALMLGSGAIWLLIGASVGFGVNIFTIGAALLSGVAGALSAMAASQEAGDATTVTITDAGSAPAVSVNQNNAQQALKVASPNHTAQYDQAKWNALVKYDQQIGEIASKLQPYGQKWVDEFASSYLALNDKRYLPDILKKIAEDAAVEEEEKKSEKLRREAELLELQRVESAALARREQERLASAREQERRIAAAKQIIWGTPIRLVALVTLVSTIILGGGGIIWWKYFRTYDDVFAFCKVVPNTDDLKHRQYSGELVPQRVFDAVNARFRRLGVDTIARPEFLSLRCMDGGLYQCSESSSQFDCKKPNTSGTPSELMRRFCIQNPNSQLVPEDTGGATDSQWTCIAGRPAIKGKTPLDKNGFFENTWRKVDH